MTVLLIGHSDMGPDFELISTAVADRGGRARVVDLRDWPGESPVTYGPGRAECVVGEDLDLEAVSGAFAKVNTLFRPFLPRFADDFESDPRRAAFVTREYRGLFESLLGVLGDYGVRTCPPVDALYWHDRKPLQLHRLRRAGVPVPDTVFTSEPAEVRAFFEDHDRVVHKPVTQNARVEELTEADLTDERLAALASAPVAFQEYVSGEDRRAYVLDGEVLATAALPTDDVSFKEQDRIDSERVEATDAEREAALRATEVAGLRFAAVDLVRGADGSLAVLEVNPAPGFGFLDRSLAEEIAAGLADYLLGER